ncbi:MAG: class D beta-lactamase [Gammaproteobacteria bacterium]
MKRLFTAAILLLTSQAYALDWKDSPQVGKLFNNPGVKGTFVLYDVTAQRLIGHNHARANTRFVPASTFKIPNTLIGLSVGAVKNVDEVLPYGGKPQPFKAWEKDMRLREAITVSNPAIYQELARRIGLKRMRDGVSRMDFGNGEIGAVVDDFWLVGPLKISAVEQTRFLAKLARDALPFPKDFQESVREVIQLEQRDNWTLYGKTGWVNAPNPGVGWWVGWVQKDGHVYAFALNIDIQQATDASKRVELGKASLKALGVL